MSNSEFNAPTFFYNQFLETTRPLMRQQFLLVRLMRLAVIHVQFRRGQVRQLTAPLLNYCGKLLEIN